MISRLRLGFLDESEPKNHPEIIDESAKLVRRALLVYEGDFDSMDGPVKVSHDDLKLLTANHNALIQNVAKLAGVGESDLQMKDFPPVQLDHSVSAKDTVGRLIGPISLEPYTTKAGKNVMGIYGNVCILGAENVQKVADGRWTHLSVGVDFENGKFSELTITPFPAAPEASLLSKMASKFEVGHRVFSIEFDEQSKKFAVIDAAGQRIHEADSEELAKQQLEKDVKAGRLSRLASGVFDVQGKKFSWVENEKTGEIDVFTGAGEPVGHADSVAKAKEFVEYEMKVGRIQLREGDVMKDSEHLPEEKKMKKKKMQDKDAHEAAETPAEEAAEHKMKKLEAEEKEDDKHLVEDEDEDAKEMAGEMSIERKYKGHEYEISKSATGKFKVIVDDSVEKIVNSVQEADAWAKKMIDADEDEMSEDAEKMKKRLEQAEDDKKAKEAEEKEQLSRMRSMKEQIKKLSSDFRKTSDAARLAARRGMISTRLSKLRAEAKITPAEIKKIDIVKLATEADSTISAVLKTYEAREPVIMVGAMGSIKAENISSLSAAERMTRLEMETRQNMTLLRNTLPKKLASTPEEVSIHIDTAPHADIDSEYEAMCKMMDDGKLDDVKEKMKAWMKKLQYGTSPATMASAEETEKHLSSLAESAEKMQNQFNELQKLAGSLVGI